MAILAAVAKLEAFHALEADGGMFCVEEVLDDLPAPLAVIDALGDLLNLVVSLAELVSGVAGAGIVHDGLEEEGVLEETLDGFDEKRGEVPCMGIRLGKGMGLGKVCGEPRCLWERIEMGERRGMAGNVGCIWGLHMWNLVRVNGCTMDRSDAHH